MARFRKAKATPGSKPKAKVSRPRKLVARLETAIRNGDLEEVKRLIKAGDRPNVSTGEDSALCCAAKHARLGIARYLLEQGADPNHRGTFDETPLHHAAEHGVQLVRLLLEHRAQPNVLSRLGAAPLHKAVSKSPACAMALLEAGADPAIKTDSELLHWLVWARDDAELVSALLDRGMPVGRKSFRDAVAKARVRTLRVLLERGADVNWAIGEKDEVPGGLRDGADRREMFGLLVRAGLDPRARGESQETALMIACGLGDLELVEILLKRGADPNVALRRGTTALTKAAEGGNATVTKLLVAHGATGRVPGVDERASDGALIAARKLAEESPEDPDVRIAYARVLLRLGFRAAAWHELCAAEKLGVPVPAEAVPDFAFENPKGIVWRLIAGKPPLESVAPALEDPRFPGARVRNDRYDREAPLVLAMGTPCTKCDSDGQMSCPMCGGSGTASGPWSDTEYSCSPTALCDVCVGTHFAASNIHAGDGACRHPFPLPVETTGEEWELRRCPKCGLAHLLSQDGEHGRLACGVCALFECRCAKTQS